MCSDREFVFQNLWSCNRCLCQPELGSLEEFSNINNMFEFNAFRLKSKRIPQSRSANGLTITHCENQIFHNQMLVHLISSLDDPDLIYLWSQCISKFLSVINTWAWRTSGVWPRNSGYDSHVNILIIIANIILTMKLNSITYWQQYIDKSSTTCILQFVTLVHYQLLTDHEYSLSFTSS